MASLPPMDWWAFAIAFLRMDPVNTLLAATLTPRLEQCASFGALHALQQGLVALLGSEHVARFPQRPSYTYSLLKMVVAQSEAAARRILREGDSTKAGAGGGEEEEEDQTPVCDELLELYLDCATGGASGGGGGIDKNESATFYTAMLAAPFGGDLHDRYQSEVEGGASNSDTAFFGHEGTMGRFVPMRVTSAFVNVGLAVWPAAHIAVDLIATLAEMNASSAASSSASPSVGCVEQLQQWFPNAPPSMIASLARIPMATSGFGGAHGDGASEAIRILELGAGVGLTPAVLHKRYAYASAAGASGQPLPSSSLPRMAIAVTDYQPNILDNCSYNLGINGVTYAQYGDSGAFERGEKCSSSPPPTSQRRSGVEAAVVPLDWNERAETRQVVRACAPQLAIAADCIYDRCVLEGLSETLRDAMTVKKDGCDGDADANECVSVIIQTHRNDATQTELHDKLGSFAHVFSFHYDAAQHRLVPLAPFQTREGGADALCYGWQAGSRPRADAHPASCIPLTQCGDWRVEMNDIMYVHFMCLKKQHE